MADLQQQEVAPGAGLDESPDDAFTPPNVMRACVNAVFPDGNTVAKRQGIVPLGSTPANARKLLARGNELLCTDGASLFSWAPSQVAWENRGPVSPCTVSRKLLASGNNSVAGVPGFLLVPQATVAESGGIRVYAWNDGSGLSASVYDSNAKSYIVPATLLSSTIGDGTGSPSNAPRVVIVGALAYIFYWEPGISANAIAYTALNLGNIAGGWSTPVAVPSVLVDQVSFFDVSTGVDGSGNPYVLLANGSNIAGFSAGQLIYLQLRPSTGTSFTQNTTLVTTLAAGTTYTALSIAGNNTGANTDDVFITYATSTGSGAGPFTTSIFGTTWTYVGVAVATPFVIYTRAGYSSASMGAQTCLALGVTRIYGLGSGSTAQWLVAGTFRYRIWDTVAGGTSNFRDVPQLFGTAETTGGIAGTYGTNDVVGFQGASKPIAMSVAGVPTVFVLTTCIDGLPQGQPRQGGAALTSLDQGGPTVVLLQLPGQGSTTRTPNALPCAVAAPRFAGPQVATNFEVAPFSSGTGFTALGTEEDASGSISISALEFDFASTALWQTQTLGDWTWIAGGMPQIYDGSTLTEVGFVHAPLAPVVNLPAAGVTVIPKLASLSYILVFVQQDQNGNIHRSPPSDPTVIDTTAGYPSAKITFAKLRATYRQLRPLVNGLSSINPVRIEIYRNSDVTPTIWFRLTTIANVSDNLSGVETLTYTDTSGAVLNGVELYTTGGGVPSDGPPNLTGLSMHGGRLFGISEDGQTVYFTSAWTRAEAPRFTDAFTLDFPETPLTMLWSLEEKLHAATSDRIWYVLGDGPADNGAGSTYQTPQLWQPNLGVLDPRGFALFEGGAVLATSKGVYVQDRAGSFTWLGQRFRRTFAAEPVVTSIVALDGDGVVRISLAQTEQTDDSHNSGDIVHWDYRKNRISIHSTAMTTFGRIAERSAVQVGGLWTGLSIRTTSGVTSWQVAQESPSTNLDGGNYVSLIVETGWFRPEGSLGGCYLRLAAFRFLSTTPHGLFMSVSRNYGSAGDSPQASWTDAQLSALPMPQVQYRAPSTHCAAFSFTILDVAPSVAGVGAGTGPTMRMLTAWFQPAEDNFRFINPGAKR